MNDRELLVLVQDKVQECLNTASAYYRREFKMPTIEWCRGRSAGWAYHGPWLIKINRILLIENIDEMINVTVPHEVAHLIDFEMNPGTRVGKKRSIHGYSWKMIMMMFGADHSRTHDMDTSNAAVRKAPVHVYVCRCGKEMHLGPKRHKNHATGRRTYFNRSCKNHGGYTYVGLLSQGSNASVAARDGNRSAPKKITKPTGYPTKLAHCEALFRSTTGTRAEIIKLFIDKAGCTKAGAGTYYATLKKRLA